jgi:hypothetical protein
MRAFGKKNAIERQCLHSTESCQFPEILPPSEAYAAGCAGRAGNDEHDCMEISGPQDPSGVRSVRYHRRGGSATNSRKTAGITETRSWQSREKSFPYARLDNEFGQFTDKTLGNRRSRHLILAGQTLNWKSKNSLQLQYLKFGGEGGIRTPVTLTGKLDFETPNYPRQTHTDAEIHSGKQLSPTLALAYLCGPLSLVHTQNVHSDHSPPPRDAAQFLHSELESISSAPSQDAVVAEDFRRCEGSGCVRENAP